MLVRAATTLAALSMAAQPVQAAGLGASFLYSVASTTGLLATNGASLAYDAANRELYVISDGIVRVVNEVGMEVYTWPQSEELGQVREVAPLEDGDVLALRYRGGLHGLVRCNFRGEPIAEVVIEGLPKIETGGFDPTRMIYRAGLLYLADLGTTRRVAIVDVQAGRMASMLDLAEALDLTGKQADYTPTGYAVAQNGDQYFTVGPMARVLVVRTSGELATFGRSGSAPGKFGQIAGVAVDEDGRVYVTDLLKSAVMVFDRSYVFLAEFGYRGQRPGNLVAPRELVAAGGKLFVSQQARRGVAVYGVTQAG